jgi:ERCC4-related helicase
VSRVQGREPRAPAQFIRKTRNLTRLADLKFRTYQAHSAWCALRGLAHGNLILKLPQGTGKTFVSQLVSSFYLQRNRDHKILVIAPTKELREQYVGMAAWMGQIAPRLTVVNFKEPFSGIRKQVRLLVERADMIVTTPELFSNRLQWISPKSFSSIKLCILDEVDLWLVDDYDDPEGKRYHAALAELKDKLKSQSTRFMGLTASDLSDRGRALLIDDLGCKELAPFHPSIVKWLPKVRIEPVRCFDPSVALLDEAISERSSNLVGQLNAETGGELMNHVADFWLFVKALSRGARGPLAASLAAALLDNERQRLQLYEDLTSKGVKVKRGASLARKGRPSVIYCREVAVVRRFENEPWDESPAVAYSGLGDRYLVETQRFKRGLRDILLMTRDLGKRGLDFPMARTLILCSPKGSALVMDQELCRTRGQRRDRRSKIVYVLYYDETYEAEKMRRVLGELVRIRMYARYPKYRLSKSRLRWLNERVAFTKLEYISLLG